MVWFGHAPVTVILLPATSEGAAVPVPPLETGTVGSAEVERVPLVMLAAFVVSVVALGAKPVISAAVGCEREGTPLAAMALSH